MGIVEEVGGGVDFVEVGDRVSVPFDIACGRCRSGHQGWTSFCERVDPIEGMQGVAYGYADTGPYAGGQAELLRVPFADVNLLPLPSGTEHENDFTMLSDIFPTAWHGTVLAGVRPGDAVAVFGVRARRSAGRAQRAHPGRPTGVQRRRPRRPAHAGRVDGVDPGRRPHTGGPVEQILDATGGVGADCGVEAAGACRRTTPPAPSTSSSSSTTWSRAGRATRHSASPGSTCRRTAVGQRPVGDRWIEAQQTGSNVVSVAEHAVMQLLALVRNYVPAYQQVVDGRWDTGEIAQRSCDLESKTIGIYGAGAIGQLIALRLKPFGVQVLYYKRSRLEHPEEALIGARCARLDEMQEQCDAVVSALESGQVGGYAGDIWYPEPAPADHPWRSMPRQMLTPHVSGTTLDAQRRYAADTRMCLEASFAGKPIERDHVIVTDGEIVGGAYAAAYAG